ncbi:hypothetical protein F383_38029 [Gossypium arboreum]|uniref:Uncharacterized protein n=1 Tax=Gossypium arboreum TaxID=29729 RepID=A0A0B0MDK6_GOSAR|nr:hypothetical protein F383_38029 [Gossypium arboreum]
MGGTKLSVHVHHVYKRAKLCVNEIMYDLVMISVSIYMCNV